MGEDIVSDDKKKVSVPAAMRLDLSARVRTVASCLEAGGPFSVERSFGESWCGGCGYRVADHERASSDSDQ